MEELEGDWDGAVRVGNETDLFPGLAQAFDEEDLFGRAPQFDFDIWEGPRGAASASEEEEEDEGDLVWRGCAVALDPSEDHRYSRAPRVLARPFPASQQSPPDFASVLSPDQWRDGPVCGNGNESGPDESSSNLPPQHDDIDCAAAPLLPKSYPLEVSTFVVMQPVRVVARLIGDWLERRTADYDFDPASCSFSVLCYSDYAKITFNIYFFSRAGADGRPTDDRVLVEFQRRSGDGFSFTRIFHAIRAMLRVECARMGTPRVSGSGSASLPPVTPTAASSALAGMPPAPQVSEMAPGLALPATVPSFADVDLAAVAAAVASASDSCMSAATPTSVAAVPQPHSAVAPAPESLGALPTPVSVPQSDLADASTRAVAAPPDHFLLPEDSDHARQALRPVRQMLRSEFADVQREGCRLVARLAELESNAAALCEGPMLRAVLDATDARDPCVSRCAASAAANLATHVFRDKPWVGETAEAEEEEEEQERVPVYDGQGEEGTGVTAAPAGSQEARNNAAARAALGHECANAEARIQNPATSRQFRRECARFLFAATHDAQYRKIIRSTGRVPRRPRQLGALTPRPAISAIMTPVPAQPTP